MREAAAQGVATGSWGSGVAMGEGFVWFGVTAPQHEHGSSTTAARTYARGEGKRHYGREMRDTHLVGLAYIVE